MCAEEKVWILKQLNLKGSSMRHMQTHKEIPTSWHTSGPLNIEVEKGIHFNCHSKIHRHYLLKLFTEKPAKKKLLSWKN
jgi:hypothetical protein